MKLTITGSTILQSLSDDHPISSHYDPIISVFKPMFFDVSCFLWVYSVTGRSSWLATGDAVESKQSIRSGGTEAADVNNEPNG